MKSGTWRPASCGLGMPLWESLGKGWECGGSRERLSLFSRQPRLSSLKSEGEASITPSREEQKVSHCGVGTNKARVAGLLEKMLEGGKVKKTEGKRTRVCA